MRRASRTCAAALALAPAVLAAAPAAAQDVKSARFENVVVTASTAMPDADADGWLPVRILLENRGAEAVALGLEVSSGWNDVLAASGSARVEPGGTLAFQWLVPVMPDATGGSRVTVLLLEDGKHLSRLDLRSDSARNSEERLLGVLFVGTTAAEFAVQVHDSPIQVPAELAARDAQLEMDALAYGGSRRFQRLQQLRPFAATMPTADLPTDWRAYSTLAMVVVDAGEPPSAAAAAALGEWVALGGLLVVQAPNAEGRAWLERADLAPAERQRLEYTSAEGRDAVVWYRHGFGRIGLRPRASVVSADPWIRELLRLPLHDDRAAQPASLPDGPFGLDARKLRPRIPGLERLPLRGLTLLLLAFAILVGPVQLLLLRRRPERTWRFLVWTPLTAFGFALAVVLTTLFAQGIGKKEAALTFTWLDQREHRAVAFGARQLFVGNNFGVAPRLEPGALLLPHDLDLRPNVEDRYEVLPEAGGALRGAWAPARIPVHLRTAWSGSLRGELRIRRDGEEAIVTSGFDVRLSELAWRDAEGALWQAEGALEPGGEQRLRRSEEDAWQPGGSVDSLLVAWPAQLPQKLPVGTWRARAAAAPWLPDHGVPARSAAAEHWILATAEERP